MASAAPEGFTVVVKWNGKQITVSLPSDADVACLKRCIEAETSVQPKRQKLLNVKAAGAYTRPLLSST